MPARTFRVYFTNKTNFRLMRTSEACQGAWTDPWQTPAYIEPGQQVAWQSESDTMLEGTQGHVSLAILDDQNYFAGHTGHGDTIVVTWHNPYLGTIGDDHPTNCKAHFMVAGTVPGSGGTFSDEGRVIGDALDYSSDQYGPVQQYDEAGPISTEGWVQVIPGVLALPIPTGIIDHAQAWFSLNFTPHREPGPVQEQQIDPHVGPGSTHTFEPMVDLAVDQWHGTWAQGALTVTIRPAGADTFAIDVIDPHAPTVSLAAQAGIIRRRPDVNPAMPMEHRNPIAPQTQELPRGRLGPALVLNGHSRERPVGIASPRRAYQPTSDTLELAGGIRLELNGSYDGRHQLDGYRLHYVRVADGAVVGDALLTRRVNIK